MSNPETGPRSRAPDATPIAEAQFVAVNGTEQWVTIRGADIRNPILFLISGPGAAFSPLAPFFAPWEQSYTLVQWDQPGAGATAMSFPDLGALSLDDLAHNAITIIEFVLKQLGKRKLILLCMSAGTMIGLKIAAARPDLVAAYVGCGQFTHWQRQDALSYEISLRNARATGDTVAIAALEVLGPPPYKDTASDAIKSSYAGALTPDEQKEFDQLAEAMRSPPMDANYLVAGMDGFDHRAQATRIYDAMRAEIVTFDARRVATKFKVPMLFFQGEHDAFSVTSEVEAYAAEVTAPLSRVVIVPGGGHSCLFLRATILYLLDRHVRPLLGP